MKNKTERRRSYLLVTKFITSVFHNNLEKQKIKCMKKI